MHVPEWTTVGEFRAATAAAMPTSVLLTGFGGAPSALLQTGALRAVTGAAGDVQRLREIRDPLARVPSVPPDTGAHDALELGVPVAVVDAGQIIGIVGLDEVRRAAGRDAIEGPDLAASARSTSRHVLRALAPEHALEHDDLGDRPRGQRVACVDRRRLRR